MGENCGTVFKYSIFSRVANPTCSRFGWYFAVAGFSGDNTLGDRRAKPGPIGSIHGAFRHFVLIRTPVDHARLE